MDVRCSLREREVEFFGFIAALESFELRSAVGRRKLMEMRYMTDAQSIEKEQQETEKAGQASNAKMVHALSEVQDIKGTVERLKAKEIMDDIQLFELKHFAMTASEIHDSGAEWVDPLREVVDILDPNKERVDTFYIYDSYDQRMAEMRREWKEPTADQFAQMAEVEEQVRVRLTTELRPLAERIARTLEETGMLDLRIGKVHLAEKEGLVMPKVAKEKTRLLGLSNMQVRTALQKRGKEYQETDIEFQRKPTLVTGMNMGGKTVMLKALATAQMMFQYGFAVAAREAEMMLMEDVLLSVDDKQDGENGLSSFAAEIMNVDYVVRKIREERNVLVLIDELARTTNPVEGRRIVNAVINILAEKSVAAFVTTHYDGIKGDFRRLRVKGLREDAKNLEDIDYQTVETTDEEVPHEAMKVAGMMGVDAELLAKIEEVEVKNI